MRFSIITVALNPGEKLEQTMQSILSQTFTDYEVILKDGGSTDGSMDSWKNGQKDARVRYFDEKDKGIYEAMNQAVAKASGEFVIFMNCGDVFADETVLERTEQVIRSTVENAQNEMPQDSPRENPRENPQESPKRLVFYGDTVGEKSDVIIASAPEINGFTCYRNIPCHQSCFYSRELCVEKPYDLRYRIRADYDHFLWCFYRGNAGFVHMDFPVSVYEGNGFSEKKENRKRDEEEHRQITRCYMKKSELMRYKTVMFLTLAPLRRKMAESKRFAGVYHKMKEALYRK